MLHTIDAANINRSNNLHGFNYIHFLSLDSLFFVHLGFFIYHFTGVLKNGMLWLK